MSDQWLVYNPRSKSCDETVVIQIETLFAEAGRPIGRKLSVGEDDLPDRESATGADVALVVVLSGDGTISALADALAGWPGTLLALPGGTMNLLARALHGESTAEEIVAAYLAGEGADAPVPVIRVADQTAYAGIIVGPSSAWADVREDMRNLDIKSIGANALQALEATFREPGVGIEGEEAVFPAIYLEPRNDGLTAFGVQADSAGDLLAHGLAWLRGDFREGPSQDLDVGESVTLASQASTFDILVDGERAEAPNPATFTAAQSKVRFFSMRGQVRWS